jgi:hypothetical protein
MSELEALQSAFARYLFTGDPAITNAVVTTARMDAARRLSIYSNAYRARLSDVLVTDYPVLRAVLGGATFDALCVEYIAALPSTSFTLRGFGRHLPQWIEQAPGVVERPSMIELASFEWAFIEAFDAPDVEAIGVAQMARIAATDWPALRFAVHPSVQLVETRFNTLLVWDAVKAAGTPPDPTELPASCAAVVWRQSLTTVFRSMQPDESLQWRLLARGEDFAAQCAALADRMDPREVPLRAATSLRNWLAEGLISGLHTS